MPGFEKLITRDPKTINTSIVKEDIEARKDKTFFPYTGTQVFCGRQGKGKTISMVYELMKIKAKYPECKVCTNLKLIVPWDYVTFSDIDSLAKALSEVNNGTKGVVYAIDEIHTYFNALDSKNIPSYIFTQISQQRKQRKLILGTSQLFLRIAKPFREQCDIIVMCDCIGGVFNIMRAYDGATLSTDDDGHIMGELKKVGWFMQTPELRSCYDTYQVVVSGREEYEQAVNLKTELNIKGGRLRR